MKEEDCGHLGSNPQSPVRKSLTESLGYQFNYHIHLKFDFYYILITCNFFTVKYSEKQLQEIMDVSSNRNRKTYILYLSMEILVI